MEPELSLPCQTVAFLQVPEDTACDIMKKMPTMNINYDVSIKNKGLIMQL